MSQCFMARLFILPLLGCAGFSLADPIVEFRTPADTTVHGWPVNASARFTFNPYNLGIDIVNWQTPVNIAQQVSGLAFKLSKPIPESGISSVANVPNWPAFVVLPTRYVASSVHWTRESYDGGLILCAICPEGIGSATSTDQMIIGPPSYSRADSTLLDEVYQPFLNEILHFTFTGLPLDASISSVTFFFGPDRAAVPIGGATPEVPEPGTAALAALGLIVTGWWRARRS